MAARKQAKIRVSEAETAHSLAAILTAVENWYARHARDLPWRVGPKLVAKGERQDPYRAWLSEIMLQQTTVPHAAPYFLKFVERWPTVEKLAKAKWEDVSAAWAGLGYYSRARNLHACAQVVAKAGGFPQTRDGLLELPGVGPYTAAAIAAITFDEKTAPVDGNIERVVSRLFAIGSDGTEAGWRASKAVISARAQEMFAALGPKHHAGDLAQGLMDLGATVCTPRNPACAICPLTEMCAARKSGEPERWPVKAAKKAVPTRFGAAYVVTRGDEVLLERRGPSGLLGGMLMPLSSDWTEANVDAPGAAPAGLKWEHVGEVRHVFTHFALRLEVWRAEAPKRLKLAGEWLPQDEALKALPTVGRKALKLALGGSSQR